MYKRNVFEIIYKPNYFVDYLEESPWIHMPYEKYEELRIEDLE